MNFFSGRWKLPFSSFIWFHNGQEDEFTVIIAHSFFLLAREEETFSSHDGGREKENKNYCPPNNTAERLQGLLLRLNVTISKEWFPSWQSIILYKKTQLTRLPIRKTDIVTNEPLRRQISLCLSAREHKIFSFVNL